MPYDQCHIQTLPSVSGLEQSCFWKPYREASVIYIKKTKKKTIGCVFLVLTIYVIEFLRTKYIFLSVFMLFYLCLFFLFAKKQTNAKNKNVS